MKCFIRSESKFRGLLPAPPGLARRGSATWGLFTWLRVVPGGPFSWGAAQRAPLSGACFMFPPLFHVPCWPRSYYTGACSPPPSSRSIAPLALSVAVVPVKSLPPVPLVSDTPFPALLAWEDWVREICQQRTMLAATLLKSAGTIHISRHNRGLKRHGRAPSSSAQ